MNMAETKLACIMKIHQPVELFVLTVDGSPHCVQLHVVAEDMLRYFSFDLGVKHVVVERGNVIPIDGIAVKTARHLHKVQRLLRSQ